jgi:hypothetical protein
MKIRVKQQSECKIKWLESCVTEIISNLTQDLYAIPLQPWPYSCPNTETLEITNPENPNLDRGDRNPKEN